MNYPTKNLRRILFLDIETATEKESFSDLDELKRSLWAKKMRRNTSIEDYPAFEEELASLYHDRAAIFAEFSKVVCISVGYFNETGQNRTFRVKSFFGTDEPELLSNFHSLLNEHFFDRFHHFLCGHNIKEFDIPFLCRRTLVHHLSLPNLMNIAGYKPWQLHHVLDTMEMWKFGDYKNYTSLELLCSVTGVHSSKTIMEGHMVSPSYWSGKLDEIVRYCQEDVISTASIYLRLCGLESLESENIEIVE